MKNKLTLRLEEDLIKRAKKYAQKRGTSVSQIVAEYFALIEEDKPGQDSEMPPLTSSLCGILKGTEISETDYKDHLEEKYLKSKFFTIRISFWMFCCSENRFSNILQHC